jgi:hypothetical protein
VELSVQVFEKLGSGSLGEDTYPVVVRSWERSTRYNNIYGDDDGCDGLWRR